MTLQTNWAAQYCRSVHQWGEKHKFRTLWGWWIKSNTGIFILTRHPFSGFASGIPAFCIWTTAAVKVWRPGDGVSGAGGTAGQSCHRRPSYTSRTVTLPTALCSMNWREVGLGGSFTFLLLLGSCRWSVNEKHVSSETLGTNCRGVLVAGPEKPLDCKTISDTRYIWDTPRSSGWDPLKNNIWSTIQLFNLPERVATCSFLRRESTEGSHFGKNIVLVFGEFSP